MTNASSVLLVLAVLACRPGEPGIVVSELPPYTRQEAAVFDDSIAPGVFDPDADAPLAGEFPEAVRRADFIVPARLVAINRERHEQAVRYELLAEAVGPTLLGAIGDGPIELDVSRTSPSQPLLRAMDTQLVGTKLLVIARRYQLDGKMVVHFRAEPDTVAIRDAIEAALRDSAAQPTDESAAGPE
jgi:hypothetical protein